jgi:GYF domain
MKSREYFTGVFGGSSALSSSPPEKDIWGSATKKGSFDEHGKFIVTENDEASQTLESETLEREPVDEESVPDLSAVGQLDSTQATDVFQLSNNNFNNEPSDTFNNPLDNFNNQVSESFGNPLSDTFGSVGGFPPLQGRATSRFSSLAMQDDQFLEPDQFNTPFNRPYTEDHEDEVNDILSFATDPRALPSPQQTERLTSSFASQTLSSDPIFYPPFESDGPRRESSQFFPPGGQNPNAGLFEHPVVPQQPTLPPAPPQTTRVMIMADKLRWVYKDPQGNIQGPFTGLEMHEWYRGGYFHVNLEVKRDDDPTFEPLHSLVKRIGNQREPFLVPLPSRTQTQVIPPRSTTTLSAWNTTLFGEEDGKPWLAPAAPLPLATTIVGTTLTADQQNALERRKQEEQYLLVRQREMAQQPPATQNPLPAISHVPQPYVAPPAPALAPFQANYPPIHPSLAMGITHHVHTPAPVQVQSLPPLDTLRNTSSQGPPTPSQFPSSGSRNFMTPWGGQPTVSPGPQIPVQPELAQHLEHNLSQEPPPKMDDPVAPPPTTAYQPPPPVPVEQEQEHMPVTEEEESLPIPLPVQALLEEPDSFDLHHEDMEPSSIIAISAPSPARTAPWAKEEPKKPALLSLKQIQELEAKRAAEQARKLALERQAQVSIAPPVPTVGSPQQTLPASSTWGSVAAKGWSAKSTGSTGVIVAGPGKKTMAQIQKEEEEDRAKLASKVKEVGVGSSTGRGYAGVAATVSPKVGLIKDAVDW